MLDEFNSNSNWRNYNLMDPVNNPLSFEGGDAGRAIMGDLKEREKETKGSVDETLFIDKNPKSDCTDSVSLSSEGGDAGRAAIGDLKEREKETTGSVEETLLIDKRADNNFKKQVIDVLCDQALTSCEVQIPVSEDGARDLKLENPSLPSIQKASSPASALQRARYQSDSSSAVVVSGGQELEKVRAPSLENISANKSLKAPRDSNIFTWMKNTPAKTSVKKQAGSNPNERKKTPNPKKILEEKNILSAPRKKKINPSKLMARSQSDISQPKISNVYKRVPLKRPSFEFESNESTEK